MANGSHTGGPLFGPVLFPGNPPSIAVLVTPQFAHKPDRENDAPADHADHHHRPGYSGCPLSLTVVVRGSQAHLRADWDWGLAVDQELPKRAQRMRALACRFGAAGL